MSSTLIIIMVVNLICFLILSFVHRKLLYEQFKKFPIMTPLRFLLSLLTWSMVSLYVIIENSIQEFKYDAVLTWIFVLIVLILLLF